MKLHETTARALLVGLFHLTLPVTPPVTAQATTQAPNCNQEQDLITVPEIGSRDGVLRAEMTLASGRRAIWGAVGDSRCFMQDIRYLTGRDLLPATGVEDPAFSRGDPIPGPTLRARVGDLIQIRFLNQVDTRNFALSLDAGYNDSDNTTGCDEVRSEEGLRYPSQGDVMPNCLHGSSTSNIHFHGTHTTPNTTGDNILLFVRPAPRDAASGNITQDSSLVNRTFSQIWEECGTDGPPTEWGQLPQPWRADQERLLKEYDRTAPYRGVPGDLPEDLKLWPANEHQIESGIWPQYQIGAYPYCFRLADPETDTMGQAPGTHWYHAHKHGSTALNVANGLTGVFVIEGQYDDDLRRFYGAGFRDRVLMIQQISTNPFPLLNPTLIPRADRDQFQLSVNGRLNPVVTMRPGEVQLWRLVNGAYRDAVELQSFAALDGSAPGGLAWRQIAQDGVQFAYANYEALGAVNQRLNLAPANRADLLVKAPLQPGRYALIVQPNVGIPLDPSQDQDLVRPVDIDTLLTVRVEGPALSPAQDFIQNNADFPTFPAYLADIPEDSIHYWREVDFGRGHNIIDGESFNPEVYSQVMKLNSKEEWKISNAAKDKAHPFHIHVNPFQITEVFQPNLENTSDPTMPCYVDPKDPATWKPCSNLPTPYVWWDTFAIPTSATVDGVTIPGYFKMRSRFVDFTGTYVLHCHILIHEDRGMMQLVQVVSDKPPYRHR